MKENWCDLPPLLPVNHPEREIGAMSPDYFLLRSSVPWVHRFKKLLTTYWNFMSTSGWASSSSGVAEKVDINFST